MSNKYVITNCQFNIIKPDDPFLKDDNDYKWKCQIFSDEAKPSSIVLDDHIVTVKLVKPPNIFHRWMLWFFFGMKWTKISNKQRFIHKI